MSKTTDELLMEYQDYLDERLKRKNDLLVVNSRDQTRMLLKTERGELEIIRLQFLKLFRDPLTTSNIKKYPEQLSQQLKDHLVFNIIDDSYFEYGEYLLSDDSLNVVGLRRSTWNLLHRIEPQFGFFSGVNKLMNYNCAKCGSFSISCRNLFNVLKFKPEWFVGGYSLTYLNLIEDDDERLEGSLWGILCSLVETKLLSTDEENRFVDESFPEKKLLYCEDGNLIFQEDTPGSLGLKFDDTFWRVNPECESCRDMFV